MEFTLMAIEPTTAEGLMSASEGALRIAIERQRQTTDEGWSPEHDDEHDKGELLSAAESYIAAISYDREDITEGGSWPWEPEGFKPSDDAIRNLEKAGALIAAEIDRLYRRKLRGLGWAV